MATSHRHDNWGEWKSRHGMSFSAEEDEICCGNWEKCSALISAHNEEHGKGNTSYRMKMNQYGHMTHEDFKKKLCGYRMATGENVKKSRGYVRQSWSPPTSEEELPPTVDWRNNGYVTGMKNQGTCGSCWAFSACGSLAGQHFKETGKLLDFSQQQLVDCSGDYGNLGCQGGNVDWAFNYIKDFGIETDADYPYAGKGGPSQYVPSKVAAWVKGHVNIPSGDENALKLAVATVGPISVAIDATKSFQFYESGVFNDPTASRTNLNHAVLVVGYGTTEDGHDYWIVKNSWGTEWGMDGYLWLARNEGNQIGIATDSNYPLPATEPSNVTPPSKVNMCDCGACVIG